MTTTLEEGVVVNSSVTIDDAEERAVIGRLSEYCVSSNSYGRDALLLPYILRELISESASAPTQKAEAKRLGIGENVLGALKWCAIVIKNTQIDDADLAKDILDFINKARQEGKLADVRTRFASIKRVNMGLGEVDTFVWVKGNENTRIKLKGSDLELARDAKKAKLAAEGKARKTSTKTVKTPQTYLAAALSAVESATAQLEARGTGGHLLKEETEAIQEMAQAMETLLATARCLEETFTL